MRYQLIAGIALLAIGVVLFIVGMNSANSFADQVSNTLTGRFTQNTMLYVVSGAVAAGIGMLLVVVRGGRLAI